MLKNEIFKVIDENVDNVIGKRYYLCKANLGELIDFVKGQLDGIDVTEFNQDFHEFEYDEFYDVDHETEEEREERLNPKKKTLEQLTEPSSSSYNFDRSRYLREKNEHMKFEDINNVIFDVAVENNFISLYFDNFNDKTFSGDFYLLDGFRRMFFDLQMGRNLDKDVYVKIYTKDATDIDMMHLMFSFNLWKVPQGVDVWFDRGWRLFIFKRLGIKLTGDKFGQHFGYLNVYFGNYKYNVKYDYLKLLKLVTGEQFYNDIRIIDALVDESLMRFSQGNVFNELFLYKLSQKRLDGNENDLNLDDWLHYLKVEYKEVDRINKMSVAGFFEKRIQNMVNEFFKIWENPEGLEEMKEKKPTGKMATPIEDYVFSVGSFERIVKVSSDDEIFIDGRVYQYKDNKIYTRLGTFVSNPIARIYLFFDKYYVMKHDGRYWIMTNKVSKYTDLLFHDVQKSDLVVFKGDKEELIEKIEEMTGKKWKPNTRKTEVW